MGMVISHDMLLGRWRLSLELFGRVFMEDVGAEPGSVSTVSFESKHFFYILFPVINGGATDPWSAQTRPHGSASMWFVDYLLSLIRDAPKWKFLAEAEQNETLKAEHDFLPHVGLFCYFFTIA